MFKRFIKPTIKKITQPTAPKNLSGFFSTSSRNIPPLLEQFIGHNKSAKENYFAYLDNFEKAKQIFEAKKDYPSAIAYLSKARTCLEETTDLSNLTMSLFNGIDNLQKRIQDEMPPGKNRSIILK